MQIIYTKTAVKAINELEKPMKQKVKNAIEGLLEFPPKGDIKKIQGADYSLYRLRIGKYRIIYEYVNNDSGKVLIIKDIGARGDIYN